MRLDDIGRFAERNLRNFSLNSTGWHELIRKMLFELAIGGWDMKNDVFGKEKDGKLYCPIYSEDEGLNSILKEITDKYSISSAKTCEICGGEGKLRMMGSWQTTLCLNHFLEQQPAIEIDEDLNVGKQGRVVLHLEEIIRAEVEYDLQEIWFHTTCNEEPIHFSSQEPNYYLLLKTLPRDLFAEESRNDISELFGGLQYCEICGYKAVHRRECLRCHHEAWNRDGHFIECGEDKSRYVKECQMDVFVDEDDHEKHFRDDCSFEKSPDHQVLFTYHDLQEYEKPLF